VNIRVVTPSKLSREQRHILEELSQTMKVENRPTERSSSFFDKVKDIFG
jgi:molecular chaperone DnaJ